MTRGCTLIFSRSMPGPNANWGLGGGQRVGGWRMVWRTRCFRVAAFFVERERGGLLSFLFK